MKIEIQIHYTEIPDKKGTDQHKTIILTGDSLPLDSVQKIVDKNLRDAHVAATGSNYE